MRAEAWTLWMTDLSIVRLFPDRREVPHHITADKFFIFSVHLVNFTSISYVGCAEVRATASEAVLLPDGAEPVMRPPAPAANNLEGIVDCSLPRVGSISQLHNSIIPSKISKRRRKNTVITSSAFNFTLLMCYSILERKKIIQNNSEKRPFQCNYCCLHWVMSQLKEDQGKQYERLISKENQCQESAGQFIQDLVLPSSGVYWLFRFFT